MSLAEGQRPRIGTVALGPMLRPTGPERVFWMQMAIRENASCHLVFVSPRSGLNTRQFGAPFLPALLQLAPNGSRCPTKAAGAREGVFSQVKHKGSGGFPLGAVVQKVERGSSAAGGTWH